jgi:flagellar basal-body rod protein FlgB
MPISLDNVFGIHEQALKLRAQRTELLASNLANADTPGYKAKDIDFESALRSAMNSSNTEATAMRTTDAGHMQDLSMNQMGGGLDGWIKYRTPNQPALDGNTVETHIEQAAFARNAVEYQATLQFLSSKSRSLMQAIRGSE